MKKMKPFWKIFLQKLAIGILAGLIIGYLITSVAYMFFAEYMDNLYADTFKTEQERVAKATEDGRPISELGDAMSFRFACDAETTVGTNYIYMVDEETGETVASSDRHGFIVLRDKSTEEKAHIYSVDSKYLQPISKYDNTDIQNRFYYIDGAMELSYIAKFDTEYYFLRVLNAYRGEDEAYPGAVEIMVSNHMEVAEEDETLFETVVLKPENPENYEFVSKSEDYTVLFLFVGNSYAPQIEAECKKELDKPLEEGKDSFTTAVYDGEFWPGRAACYGKFRFVDAANKSYMVYYTGEMNFKELAIYIIVFNVLIMVIAVFVAFIRAKKQYNRERYEYSVVAYRDSLIDIMAHDLRTPLMAMSGYAENLKEEANAEKRDYYVDAILNNTDYMSRIISRNLEMSKISDEDIKKNSASLELVAMLQNALDEYKTVLEERKITVNCEGSFEIKGSEAMMKTALENLATNIIKYIDDEGTIDISVKGKKLTIANTTKEKIKNPKKMWEPFVRGDESRSNNKGTGLGLAIAKSIFEKHKLKSSIEYKDGRFAVVIVK